MDELIFREATVKDLKSIVSLLANDILGEKREQNVHPLPDSYENAFIHIDSDPNQELIVVEENGEVVGTLQLTFIQYITYQGGIRAQLEAVRIRDDKRGSGLGQKMLEWAINRAEKRGVHLIQLTSDKQRKNALKFYEKLGFKASHEGMKMHFEMK